MVNQIAGIAKFGIVVVVGGSFDAEQLLNRGYYSPFVPFYLLICVTFWVQEGWEWVVCGGT